MSNKGVQGIIKTVRGTVNKNSPTILTSLGVAGLLTTTIMAVKSTPKAMLLLEEAENDKGSELDIKEKIKTAYKCYVPAALMGSITIGCILGANSINLRRNAALAGAYSLTETALKEYQSKVVETIGSNKERVIKDEISKDKLKKNPVSNNQVIITGKGETLCYDTLSGRYFLSDIETIKSAINEVSRRLMSEMSISVNEIYYALDLEGVKMGDSMGWHIDNGLIQPRFSSHLAEDGRPCLVLDFEDAPTYCDLGC